MPSTGHGGSRLRRRRPPAARGGGREPKLRTLVFWGDAPLAQARARAALAERVLSVGSAGGGRRRPRFQDRRLRPGAAQRIEDAVAAWTDDPRRAAGPGRPSVRGPSPLGRRPARGRWLHRFLRSPQSASAHCVRLAESFSLLFETELPDEVEAWAFRRDEVQPCSKRCCTARGVLFQSERRSAPTAAPGPRAGLRLRERMRGWRIVFGGSPSRVATAARPRRPSRGATPGRDGRPLERLLRVAREDMGLEIMVAGGEEAGPGAASWTRRHARPSPEPRPPSRRPLASLKDAPATTAAFCVRRRVLRRPGRGSRPRGRAPGPSAPRRCGEPKDCARSCARWTSQGPRAPPPTTPSPSRPPMPRTSRRSPLWKAQDGPRLLRPWTAAARGEGMVG